ncbi:hypothetical protein VNI00_015749 [Paramarasmius palmivorus]|uniref:Uncharacterized protein n=1 Tax=Paramarasmius palmivorus TaxID=297713 RepID=A0AAW0BI78_9AGAR
MSTEEGAPPKHWLGGNHRVVTLPRSGGGSDVYHVYALAGRPVFGDKKDRYNVEIDIPLGPVILQLRGYFDLTTLEADISVYVKVPLLPAIKLGEFKGNLRDGITITVGASGILAGSITLYVKDGWLWIKFSLEVFGQTYDAEFKLIPF